MLDWSRYLPGLSNATPEDDDPVKKALAAMGQAATGATSAIGQGASDLGSGISSGLSSAADTASSTVSSLGSGLSSAADAARSYMPAAPVHGMGAAGDGPDLSPAPSEPGVPLPSTVSATTGLTSSLIDAARGVQPRPPDPDLGPHERPYPGTVSPIVNPDGSLTTERSITVTEPNLNAGRPTNIPTVWSGRVVPDDQAIQNATYSRRGFPSYDTIDDAVSAAEQRSRDLGAGTATSIGGAKPFASAPTRPGAVIPGSDWRTNLPDVSATMAGNRQAVEDANAGRTGGVDFGTGISNAAASLDDTMQEQGPVSRIAAPISSAINAATGHVPQADPRPLPSILGISPPDTPRALDTAVRETARSLPENIRAVGQGIEQGGAAGYGSAALGALGAVGDLAPSTLLARQLNEMLPKADTPLGEVGAGDVIMTAALAKDAATLGYGLVKAGGRVGSKIATAIHEGVPAERFRDWAAGNAERVALSDARMAEQGGTTASAALGALPDSAPAYSPQPPEGTVRRYHGTASAFDAADPARFDENGLYGPGYYTTSSPEVAGGYAARQRFVGSDEHVASLTRQQEMAASTVEALRRAQSRGRDISDAEIAAAEDALHGVQEEMQRVTSQGPNVRAVDLPPDVKLLDVDAPLERGLVDRVEQIVSQARTDVRAELMGAVQSAKEREAHRVEANRMHPSLGGAPPSNDAFIQELMAAAERIPDMGKGLATEILSRAGYDGIAHTGGRRVPMMDAGGQPIEHDVSVIFPGSVNKVRNAFSGTYGGATLGTLLPDGAARPDRLAGVNRVLAQGAASTISGGIGAQVNEQLNPDDPNARLKGFAVGALGPLAAQRGARGLARLAGAGEREAGGALATFGTPGAGGAPTVPPGLLQRLPGVQQALQAAQQRAASMATRGVQPLGPIQWGRKAAAAVGYSSMIGPTTFTTSMLGGPLELAWNLPKRAAGAALPKALGGRGSLPEALSIGRGAVQGLTEVGGSIVDALRGQGRYAAVPGHEPLSQQTVNPIGHAAATALEAGGRFWSGVPDAIYGTIGRRVGEHRAAAEAATDAGLTGKAWRQHVDDLLADAEQVRSGQLPTMSATQHVIDAGEKAGKRSTYQDEIGTIGEKAKRLATLEGLPVVGNTISPFFNTPWNMEQRLLEKTPGVGAFMNTQKGFDKGYDQVVGTALVAGMAGYAAAGNITGSGPDDPEKRKMLQAQGWRPYSTNIGGYYIPNRALGEYGPLLNSVGDFHDALQYSQDKSFPGVASNYGARIGKQMQERVWLQGLSELLGALDAGQQGGLGAGAERYAAGLVTRMVPYAATARAIGTALDPQARVTERGKETTVGQRIGQQVQRGLGLGQGVPSLGIAPLPVEQDVLGRPQENPQRGAGALFPRVGVDRPEPISKAYLEGGVDIGGPPPTIGGVVLTPSQQRRWNTARGRALQEARADILGARTLPKAERQAELRRILSEASAEARDTVEPTFTPRQISDAERKAG